MSTATSNSYDEVPYPTRPYYGCHPDCMAVMGVLLGMTPAPLARCRVLEIGCSSAGNLIPIAMQFPGSQCVGIDLSPVQIAAGQEAVRDLKIGNLELRAQSLMEIDAAWGQFDFIICHGVFSWVPEVVRQKILDICQTNLSPQGIAFISYNTYPGWFARKTLRDVMNYHAKRFPAPTDRVAQSRQFLDFLDKTGLPTDSPSAEALRRLIRRLRELPDYYLFHEYLEAENQPFYFSEFMIHAQNHGLQYMGNAWQHIDLDLLHPDAKSTLLDLSEDLIQLEQFTDFLTNCPFRRTLLCRDSVALDRNPSPDVIARLHVGAIAQPVSAKPDCFSNAPETFEIEGKRRGTSDIPLAKTLFTVLAEEWPNPIPFDALWSTVESRLEAHDCLTPELAANGSALLAQTVLQAFLGNFLSLHLEPFPFSTSPRSRPRASRLARWQQNKKFPELANLRHSVVALDAMDQVILPFLDGTRTNVQLHDTLAKLVAAGKLSFTDDDDRPLTGANLRAAIDRTLDQTLERLARLSLIEA